MKNRLLVLLTASLLMIASQGAAQFITNVTIQPSNPAPGNPVIIITGSTFTTSAYSVLSQVYTDTTNHTIVVQLFKCQSPATPGATFSDTSVTGILPVGMYSLSVLLFVAQTDVNGNCGAFVMTDSDNQNITVATTTATNDLPYRTGIQLYPNPANDQVFFSLPGSAMITITDATGRVAKQIKMENGSAVNVADLPAGIYHCIVSTETGEGFSRRLVITR